MGKYRRLISRMAGSVDYWAQAAMRRFVLDIDRRMEAQSISRVALAEKLNATPAYVTKVMRGDVNFTLETMTKLALAVGGRVQVQIVDIDAVADSNRVRMAYRAAENKEPVWRSSAATELTAGAKTVRLVFNREVAANQSGDDFERLGGHAA